MKLLTRAVLTYKNFKFAIKCAHKMFRLQITSLPKLAVDEISKTPITPTVYDGFMSDWRQSTLKSIELEKSRMAAAGLKLDDFKTF